MLKKSTHFHHLALLSRLGRMKEIALADSPVVAQYSGASQFDVSQFDSFAIRQLSCASRRMRLHRIVRCHLLFVTSY
jgi:hypothetical protein